MNQEKLNNENKNCHKYVSFDGKYVYDKKPETKTSLYGNILVDKTSPVIKYRGMLDYAQALVVELQVLCVENSNEEISDNLEDVLSVLRKLMICDVKNTAFGEYKLFGKAPNEIQEISHNPKKYLGVDHAFPNKNDGAIGSKLNTLRTVIRQTELSAIEAYYNEDEYRHLDCIESLNRLSSAVYVLYLKYKISKNITSI